MLERFVYAAKSLRRDPLSAGLIIVMLGVSIGVTTGVTVVYEQVVGVPVPFDQPSRIYHLVTHGASGEVPITREQFAQLADSRPAAIDAVAAYIPANMLFGQSSRLLSGVMVTETLPAVLGVGPILGRALSRNSDIPEVVISTGLWKELFGADPRALGTEVLLNRSPHRVVGVMPEGFWFPKPGAAFWTLLSTAPSTSAGASTSWAGATVVRLTEWADSEETRQQLASTLAHNGRSATIELPRFQDYFTRQSRSILGVLKMAVIVILTVSLVNCCFLLLSRVADRGHSRAVKATLGATPGRLFGEYASEVMLLAFGSFVVAILSSVLVVQAAVNYAASILPRVADARWSLSAMAQSAELAAVSLLVLLPLGHLIRPASSRTSRVGAVGAAVFRSNHSWLALVALQFAVASAFSIVGTSILSSLLAHVDARLAYNYSGLQVFELVSEESRLVTVDSRVEFLSRVLLSLPKQAQAGIVNIAPYGEGSALKRVSMIGNGQFDNRRIGIRVTTPSYFDLTGTRPIVGRVVNASDVRGSEQVCIVNETLAKECCGEAARALGQALTDNVRTWRIAGVVPDARDLKLDEPARPFMMVALDQADSVGPFVEQTLARANLIGRGLTLDSVRSVVLSIDNTARVDFAGTISKRMFGSVLTKLMTASVAASLTALMILLCMFGLGGMALLLCRSRTRDIAIRVSLGAPRSDLMMSLVGGVMAASVTGGVVGIVFSVALADSPLGVSLQSNAGASLKGGLVPTMLILIGAVVLGCMPAVRRMLCVAPASVLRSE